MPQSFPTRERPAPSALRIPLAFLALLALATLNSRAQFNFPALPPSADTTDLTINVKVVDAVSGEPVPHSAVTVPTLSPVYGARGSNQWHFPTDAKGEVVVRVPGVTVAFNQFGLAASNASHAMRYADWNNQTPPVRAILPAEYTFRLERGGTVGGIVRDEQGKPLAGVRVALWGNGAGAYWNGTPTGKVREYSMLPRIPTNGVLTDAKGFWEFPNVPPDIAQLSLDVIRPDGAHSMFSTPSPNRYYNSWEQTEEISLAALRATNAIITLKNGVSLRGIVVDETGKPVPNAVVSERSGSGWNALVQTTTNDAQGRFVFPHRTGRQYLLSAEAEGFAVASLTVSTSPEMPDARLVLSPARPLKLRLLDESNQPVVGASVSLPEYRNRGHLLTWKGTSDAEGRLTWSSAPTQSLSLQIVPTNNLPPRMARLKPDGTEQIIRVPREAAQSINLRIRATSTDTSKPLPNFVVWQDLRPNGDFKQTLCAGTNGEATAVLKLTDFAERTGGSYRLQVRAEGHAPKATEIFYLDEGDLEVAVALKPAPIPTGTVLSPEGNPADGAIVALVGENGNLYLSSPKDYYAGNGTTVVRCPPDGRFKFDAAEENTRLVARHPSGFATLTVGQLASAGTIKLQPYARLEGVIKGAEPATGRRSIYLKAPLTYYGGDGFNLHFSTSADKEGRFVFTNVPPGNYLLFRQDHSINGASIIESHRRVVQLKHGEDRHIDYTFNGRRVTGRIEASGEVDWMNDHHILSLKLPPAPPQPDSRVFENMESFERARSAYGRSQAVLDYENKRQQFELLLDRDGNFHADDVPPGSYELNINVTKPVKNGRNRYERSNEILGSLKRDVTIPAGPAGEDFDLGSFDMEIKDTIVAQTQPLDFNAETFDGKTVNLLSLRGKPAVVAFWGKWAPGSLTKLEGIHAAVAQLDSALRPALVSVNLDANPDNARGLLQNLATGWSHTRLPGSSAFEVTERLAVDSVPTVLLLDAEGRVISRDLDGKRLATSVKRLAAKKN